MSRFLSSLSTLVLVLFCTLTSAQFTSRNTTGLMFQYIFGEGQLDDTANSTSDTTGLNWLGPINLNTAVCSFYSDRPGLLLPGSITQQVGFSQSSQASLLNSIEATRAFTMEIWFEPATLNQGSIICGIGGWNVNAPQESTLCFLDPISYEFHQNGGNFGASQAQGLLHSKSCSIEEDWTDVIAPIHLVMSYAVNGTAFLYMNGVYDGAQSSHVKSWYPYWNASHHLYLSPDWTSVTSLSWQGSIYLISMYNRTLSLAEAATNYAAGLPNALPQPIARATHLTGYQDTTTQYSLILDATDYDGVNGTATYIELVSFPQRGTLRIKNASGSWITLLANTTSYQIDTPRTQQILFEYTPPSGLYGTSFEQIGFAGHDEYARGRVGYLILDIFPVPIPTNSTFQLAVGLDLSVTLEASNFPNTTVVTGWITSLPAIGKLYQTSDGITPVGSPLVGASSSTPIHVGNAQNMVVFVASDSDLQAYAALLASGADCYVSTSFQYQLQMGSFGSGGPWSLSNGFVSVTLCNRLTSVSQNITMPSTVSSQVIQLSGTSDLNETLSISLTKLPSAGQVYYYTAGVNAASRARDGTVVQNQILVGQSIQVTNGSGWIEYRRPTDLSNTVGWNATSDSLSFTVSSVPATASNVLVVSSEALVSITLPPQPRTILWQTRYDSTVQDGSLIAFWTFDEFIDTTGATPIISVVDHCSLQLGGPLNLVQLSAANVLSGSITLSANNTVSLMSTAVVSNSSQADWSPFTRGVTITPTLTASNVNTLSSSPAVISSSMTDSLNSKLITATNGGLSTSPGFSFEAWLSYPNSNPYTSSGLIFGIGGYDPTFLTQANSASIDPISGLLDVATVISSYTFSVIQVGDASTKTSWLYFCAGNLITHCYRISTSALTVPTITNPTLYDEATGEFATATSEYNATHYHIVFTQRPNDGIRIYLQGQLVQFDPGYYMNSADLSHSNTRVVLGASGWQGRIHTVQLNSPAISDTTITSDYLAGPPPNPRPTALTRSEEIEWIEFQAGVLPIVWAGASEDVLLAHSGSALSNLTTLMTTTEKSLDFYLTSLPSSSAGTLSIQTSSSRRDLVASDLPFYFSPTTSVSNGGVDFYYTPPPPVVDPTSHFSGNHAVSFDWGVCLGSVCSKSGVNAGATTSFQSGRIYLNIEPLLIPPIAISSVQHVQELSPTKISLQGVDIDTHTPINSPMTAFWIDQIANSSTGGTYFLSTLSASTPDYTQKLLWSSLPYRLDATAQQLWFVPTLTVLAYINEGGEADGNYLIFRPEVKTVKGQVNLNVTDIQSTANSTSGVVQFYVSRHLSTSSSSSTMSFSAVRTPLTFSGSTASSGANTFLDPVLVQGSLGDDFTVGAGSSSTSLSLNTPTASSPDLGGCILLLDDALAFPVSGGVVHGLEATTVNTVLGAGQTVYLQRWRLNVKNVTTGGSSGGSGVTPSAVLVSTTPVLVSGSAGARHWELARTEWQEVPSSEASYTRMALCVAGTSLSSSSSTSSSSLPFRSATNTTANLTPQEVKNMRQVLIISYTSVIGTTIFLPAPGTVSSARKSLLMDVRVLFWSSVLLPDLSTPVNWPATTKALTAQELLAPPQRLWESYQLVLTKAPAYGTLILHSTPSSSSTTPVALCASPASTLPCVLVSGTDLPTVLSSSIDYYRVWPSSTSQVDRLRADEFEFVLQSSIALKGQASFVLDSKTSAPTSGTDATGSLVYTTPSYTYDVLTALPRQPPIFQTLYESFNVAAVQAYSTDSYPFSMIVLDQGNQTTSASGSTLAYRLTMSLTPKTGGFNLPSVATLASAGKVTLTLGKGKNDFQLQLVAADLTTLNAALVEANFQPLYADEYTITMNVTSHDTAQYSDWSSDPLLDRFTTTGYVTYNVSASTGSSPPSDASSKGGILNTLTAGQLIWIWIAVGAFIVVLICCLCARRCWRRRKEKEIARKRKVFRLQRRERKEKERAAKAAAAGGTGAANIAAAGAAGGEAAPNTNGTAEDAPDSDDDYDDDGNKKPTTKTKSGTTTNTNSKISHDGTGPEGHPNHTQTSDSEHDTADTATPSKEGQTPVKVRLPRRAQATTATEMSTNDSSSEIELTSNPVFDNAVKDAVYQLMVGARLQQDSEHSQMSSVYQSRLSQTESPSHTRQQSHGGGGGGGLSMSSSPELLRRLQIASEQGPREPYNPDGLYTPRRFQHQLARAQGLAPPGGMDVDLSLSVPIGMRHQDDYAADADSSAPATPPGHRSVNSVSFQYSTPPRRQAASYAAHDGQTPSPGAPSVAPRSGPVNSSSSVRRPLIFHRPTSSSASGSNSVNTPSKSPFLASSVPIQSASRGSPYQQQFISPNPSPSRIGPAHQISASQFSNSSPVFIQSSPIPSPPPATESPHHAITVHSHNDDWIPPPPPPEEDASSSGAASSGHVPQQGIFIPGGEEDEFETKMRSASANQQPGPRLGLRPYNSPERKIEMDFESHLSFDRMLERHNFPPVPSPSQARQQQQQVLSPKFFRQQQLDQEPELFEEEVAFDDQGNASHPRPHRPHEWRLHGEYQPRGPASSSSASSSAAAALAALQSEEEELGVSGPAREAARVALQLQQSREEGEERNHHNNANAAAHHQQG